MTESTNNAKALQKRGGIRYRRNARQTIVYRKCGRFINVGRLTPCD